MGKKTLNINLLENVPIVFQTRLEHNDVCTEDSGCAKIIEVCGYDDFFIRLHSYNDDKQHPTFDSLIGKKIRVKIEILAD